MTQEREELVWQIETSHPDLAEKTKTALRDVVDPEIGLNIIELGLVRDIIVEDDAANIRMIMTTPFCPYAPALLEMTRKKGESALERPTTIELGAEMWDPSMMEEGAGAEWGFF